MTDNPYNTGLDRTPSELSAADAADLPGTRRQRLSGPHGHRAWVSCGATMRSFTRGRGGLPRPWPRTAITRGDTVSVLLPNTPAMLECHYGVPMCGAVLHSINTRLDAAIIAFQLDHAMSKLVIVDREFMPLMQEALALATVSPVLIQYDDPEYGGPRTDAEAADYEVFLTRGNPEFAWAMPEDEWDAISINYTSGTTGDPKGVVSHHRGAYLLAQGNALTTSMQKHAVYLWTLPMFHCNGWCFPWTLSAIAGTHVCLRQVRANPSGTPWRTRA